MTSTGRDVAQIRDAAIEHHPPVADILNMITGCRGLQVDEGAGPS
ncbi:MAG: hypothetical protein ACRDS1_00065 [Pseudonocardiaceae bacterium]